MFKKKKTFDEIKQAQFIDAISTMLEVQKMLVTDRSIEDSDGCLNRKAIGYVYGFIDGALRSIGQDMSDVSIGVPITFHVLNRLFPGRGDDYVRFLLDHMGKDKMVTLGAMTGGQQYIEFSKPGNKGSPMGFARYMLEGDELY